MATVSRGSSQISWRNRREVANLLEVLAGEQTRVAERLARLREAHALTQEAAAARAHVTLRQWQRWESGESEPYARNIARISDEFQIPLNELVGSEPNLEPTQLDRIENLLNRIWDYLTVDGEPGAPGLVADAVAPLIARAESKPRKAPGRQRTAQAKPRRKNA